MSAHPSRNRTAGKPTGIKPPNHELEARVEAVLAMLARGHRKAAIIARMNSRYGVCSRTTESYLARARSEIMKRLGRSREEFRAESLAFYEAMCADEKASVGERIRARQRIDELLGLDAPKQVRTQVSGPDGGKIELEPKVVKEEFDHDAYREEFRRVILGVPSADANGKPVHPARPDPEAGLLPGGNGHPA